MIITLVKTYSTKISENLKTAIGSDEKINALIKDIKDKIMSAIKSAVDDLKRGTKDFDCCWPNGTIRSLQVCLQLLNELKV